MESIQTDNKAADIAILFDRYIELIYGVCLSYLKDPGAAQDACMEIYQHIQRKIVLHPIDNFKPWLHVTTKNFCLGILRKEKKKLTLSYDPSIMHLAENMHPIDENNGPRMDSENLKTCINKLPNEQKQAIRAFYYELLSYEDIASKMNKKVNQIRSYMQNGRRNLKICLEKKS